jgi:hypothetical protein
VFQYTHPVVSEIRLKITTIKKNEKSMSKYNKVQKYTRMKNVFSLELRNRFEILSNAVNQNGPARTNVKAVLEAIKVKIDPVKRYRCTR